MGAEASGLQMAVLGERSRALKQLKCIKSSQDFASGLRKESFCGYLWFSLASKLRRSTPLCAFDVSCQGRVATHSRKEYLIRWSRGWRAVDARLGWVVV